MCLFSITAPSLANLKELLTTCCDISRVHSHSTRFRLRCIALKRFGMPLTPSEIRTLLVETGSPQLGDTSQNIGPRDERYVFVPWPLYRILVIVRIVRLVFGPHYLFTQLDNRLDVGPLGLILVPVFLALNQFMVRINVILRNVHSAGVMMLTLIRNLLQR